MRTEIFMLVLDLKGKALSLSQLYVILAVGFLVDVLYKVVKVSL